MPIKIVIDRWLTYYSVKVVTNDIIITNTDQCALYVIWTLEIIRYYAGSCTLCDSSSTSNQYIRFLFQFVTIYVRNATCYISVLCHSSLLLFLKMRNVILFLLLLKFFFICIILLYYSNLKKLAIYISG